MRRAAPRSLGVVAGGYIIDSRPSRDAPDGREAARQACRASLAARDSPWDAGIGDLRREDQGGSGFWRLCGVGRRRGRAVAWARVRGGLTDRSGGES